MQDNESRVHETVKCVYPWETPEDTICDYVRAVVKADLGKKFPSGHTGCLSTAVVESISANIYFDKKKEFKLSISTFSYEKVKQLGLMIFSHV